MKFFPLCLSLCVLGTLAQAAAPASHPFTADDLVSLRRIDSPTASPDGKRVVFTLRTTDLEANKGRTDLWMVNVDGKGLRQLTFTPESESSPRFSPDGKSLFFLSARNGGPQQVWRLPLDGGEASQVTHAPVDVSSFGLSPDGTRLIVSMDVFVDCETLDCTKQRAGEPDKKKASGQLYTHLFVRHWDEMRDERRSTYSSSRSRAERR